MTAAVRAAVRAGLPGYRIESVTPLGEGLNNQAYEINGDLVVRFSKAPDPAELDREVRLLTAVASISPLPVPVPVFADLDRGCLAYRKLPGRPLLDLGREAPVAAGLGGFLAVLHAADLTGLAGVDDQPPAEWLAGAAATYPGIAGHLPPPYRTRVEAFLAAPPPAGGNPVVFSHNDLGIEHVLIGGDGRTITGIIDWTDAAYVDPAYDFGLLLRDLGPSALTDALDAYGNHSLTERATFYARCSVLEDLEYGVATGRHRYRDKSLDALAWLFPAGR